MISPKYEFPPREYLQEIRTKIEKLDQFKDTPHLRTLGKLTAICAGLFTLGICFVSLNYPFEANIAVTAIATNVALVTAIAVMVLSIGILFLLGKFSREKNIAMSVLACIDRVASSFQFGLCIRTADEARQGVAKVYFIARWLRESIVCSGTSHHPFHGVLNGLRIDSSVAEVNAFITEFYKWHKFVVDKYARQFNLPIDPREYMVDPQPH